MILTSLRHVTHVVNEQETNTLGSLISSNKCQLSWDYPIWTKWIHCSLLDHRFSYTYLNACMWSIRIRSRSSVSQHSIILCGGRSSEVVISRPPLLALVNFTIDQWWVICYEWSLFDLFCFLMLYLKKQHLTWEKPNTSTLLQLL